MRLYSIFFFFLIIQDSFRLTDKNDEAARFPLSPANCPRASLSTATVPRLLLQDNNNNKIIIIIIIIIIISPHAYLCTVPRLLLQAGFSTINWSAPDCCKSHFFYSRFTRKVAVCVCLCINLENAAFSSKLSNWARCANNTTLHRICISLLSSNLA